MSRPKSKDEQIDLEAAAWVIRWEDGERSPGRYEQSRWLGWLRRSPRHVQAYFDTADLYERLGRMDPHGRIDVDEWLASRSDAIVPMRSAASWRRCGGDSVAHGASPRSRTFGWGIAAGVAALAVIAALSWKNVGTQTFRTTVGQQSTYRLADGSVMNLNTQSDASIRFSARRRLVALEGEALFTVARDSSRPFYVSTRTATVMAVGTRFNVYQQGANTRVAVVEGSVQVISAPNATSMSDAARAERVTLSAGESARISRGHIARQRSLVSSAVAWQQQQLVFEDATLAEVAAEFNRYNDVQLRVQGALGSDKRLSGTFDALHPQSLLLYLKKDAAISIRADGDGITIRQRDVPPGH